jgi:hypothetical protein
MIRPLTELVVKNSRRSAAVSAGWLGALPALTQSGRGEGGAEMRADPGFSGFQLVFNHSDRASPSVLVTGQVGEPGPGREWGNFPGAPGASPPRSPHRLAPSPHRRGYE